MIQIKQRKILINHRPELILSGEIHYFRLPVECWQDRLDKLKATGCNTVASYIPWLCHEPVQGTFDLSGQTRPELNLKAFIDLCQANGLWFIARPGPFVMAELKNEGIPYWVYETYPDIIPVGWDGKPVPTRTVDYLAQDFLAAVHNWYAAVMPILAERLQPRGGPIIALQLDNEIGMLSWCSNTPDLTDALLDDCVGWLKTRYDHKTLQQRYPFSLEIPLRYRSALRSPQESWVLRWMRDLGYYMRDRTARYVAVLQHYAEEQGIAGVPFFINIHGTGGGRGLTYPVGISQLYPAYTQSDQYLAGTDYYFGNLSGDNVQDIHLCNAYTLASQLRDQPLCSLEFECGDGDYGSMQANRLDPSALELKLRLCLAQGHKLINLYLFSGGYNYLYSPAPGDGDDRIAITGECHGVAAPVKPDGRTGYAYESLKKTLEAVVAESAYWAESGEEYDALVTGFIPDYYLTEFCYPGSARQASLIDNLKANRAYGSWESLLRAILLAGYRYPALDIQNQPLPARQDQVLVLPSARYMDEAIQTKLADWLTQGGSLLLYGEVPQFDMEGEPCLILAERLGVRIKATRHAGDGVYLSLQRDGWAAPGPGVRTHFAQTFEGTALTPLLRLHDSLEVTGFATDTGRGAAIVLATAYPCDVDFFRTALEKLGVSPALRHDCQERGLFMTTTCHPHSGRRLHIINLDNFEKTFRVWWQGEALRAGSCFQLAAREYKAYEMAS